jgi:hypothetical protein
MALCPTCGHPVKERLNAAQLLRLLTDEDREVYQGRDGGWYVTRGGETTVEAVQALLDGGHIRSKYSDLPHGMYTTGRTIDVQRTLEARKRLGTKNAGLVYVGDPEARAAS